MYICTVIAFAESPLGGMRAWHIHIKRRNWTLWFWRCKNFATSNGLSKTKQRGRPLGCLYTTLIGYWCKPPWPFRGEIYTHRRGAFSVARFDNPGNAKAFTAWNEHQTGSTLFVCMYDNLLVVLSIWGRLMGRRFQFYKYYEKAFPSHCCHYVGICIVVCPV